MLPTDGLLLMAINQKELMIIGWMLLIRYRWGFGGNIGPM